MQVCSEQNTKKVQTDGASTCMLYVCVYVCMCVFVCVCVVHTCVLCACVCVYVCKLVSYRILSWGAGEQDGSRMIVACKKRGCLLGGSGGMPPSQENFEFRSSQIASDAIWDKHSKQRTF